MTRQTKIGVLIEGSAKGLSKAVNTASDKIEELEKTTRKARKNIKKHADNIAKGFENVAIGVAKWGAATAAAAATATAAMVKSGLESGDALAKQADKLGVTTEALAKFRFAAEQTGVSQEKADVALQRFTRRLADAADGSGPAVKAFEELGLRAEDLIELSPDKAFARVADKMNDVENQSRKVALSFKLFDSEGVALVNTLRAGSAGLEAMGKEAETLGLTLSRVDAAKIEQANDAMNRVRRGFTGLSQNLAAQFAPLITAVADRLFAAAEEAGGFGEIANKVFQSIAEGIGSTLNVLRFMQIQFYNFTGIFQEIGKAWAKLGKLIVTGIDKITKVIPVRGIPALFGFDPAGKALENVKGFFDNVELSMVGAISDGRAEVDRILGEPLPSDVWEDWSIEVRRQADAAAQAAADAVIEVGNTTDAVLEDIVVTNRKRPVTFAPATKDADDFNTSVNTLTGSLGSLFTDIASGSDDAFKSFARNARDGIASAVKDFKNADFKLDNINFEGVAEAFSSTLNAITSGQETSGVGALIGTVIGAYYGSEVGAAIGAGLGNAAEGIIGPLLGFGNNKGNQAGAGSFNLATGESSFAGVGKTFDQKNVDLVSGIIDAVSQLSDIIGGSSLSADIRVANKTGISVSGEFGEQRFGDDAQAAIDFLFRETILAAGELTPLVKSLTLQFADGAEQIAQYVTRIQQIEDAIGSSAVQSGLEAYAESQKNIAQQFRDSENELKRLVNTYDGSLAATEDLNAALQENRARLFEYAGAIEAVGKAVSDNAERQARDIRESVLSEELLTLKRTRERDRLQAELERLRAFDGIVDPGKIQETANRVLELNSQLFNSLEQESRPAFAEAFATIAEDVDDVVQDILGNTLDELNSRESDINTQISDALNSFVDRQEAIVDRQESSTNTFSDAVDLLVSNIGRGEVVA